MARLADSRVPGASRETDICLIVEGCYPYVPGGVSGWIDWLIRTQHETSFSVVSLWPRPGNHPMRYALPPNVVSFDTLYLQDFGASPRVRDLQVRGLDAFGEAVDLLVAEGGLAKLDALRKAHQGLRPAIDLGTIFNSPLAWRLVETMYRKRMPYGSFLHYFWAWRALLGGLFATLEYPLPRAKVYHTISTGYAGVLAARAALETGRPMLLTEHGIYTNERRIELLMADWVADTIDKGHALADPRVDLRDVWVAAFEAYSRTCYEAATEVITLYEDNQLVQQALGASPARSRVIANGIDVQRFGGVAMASDSDRPTIALIGRVVPIKDVKCFITATKIARERIPNLRALVMGPMDEDPDYTAECKALAASLKLDGCLEFTGAVNVLDYLPRIHVAVLTSLSESQPLVVLEAGAAGIPFVATNVGSCREIIEGRPEEDPHLGPGGIVTPLVAPAKIAEAIAELLEDPDRRRAYGLALRARVNRSFRSEQAAATYRETYRTYIETPDQPFAHGRESIGEALWPA
jgi:polysaccharide biosynthesis protein PelF